MATDDTMATDQDEIDPGKTDQGKTHEGEIDPGETGEEEAEVAQSPEMPVEAVRDVLALACDHLGADVGLLAQATGDTWRLIATEDALDGPLGGASPLLESTRAAGRGARWTQDEHETAPSGGADALRAAVPDHAGYLGVMLPGQPPAVLACLSPEPRTWTAEAADTLRRYGQLIRRQWDADRERTQAERQLRRIADEYPFGAIVLFDHDLRYVLARGVGLEEVGLSTKQMEGATMQEVFPPEVCAQIEPQYRRALAGDVVEQEVAFAGRVYATTAGPIHDESGVITHGVVTTQDITERRAAEDQLRLYQTALDQAHEGVVMLTAASAEGGGRRIAYVNEAFETMTGYDADEVMGGSLQVLQGPDTDSDALERIAEAFETTQAVQEQLLNYRKDGTPFWSEVAIAPVRNAEGEHAYWISIQRDITDRIEARNALRESEERWRRLVDAHPNPTYITVDGIFQYLNPSAVAIFGASSAEELLGQSVFGFAHEDVQDQMRTRRAQLAAGEATEPLEHRMHRLDGEERIVVTQSVPVTYEGEAAAQTVLRDVTEQKAAEATLREREKHLASILDNMPSGVVIVEAPSGEIVRYNRAAVDLLGHPIRAGGREGYDQYHALHADGSAYRAEEYPTARALDGEHVAQEEMVYPRDGGRIHLLVNAAPIRDEAGDIVAAVCTYQDISQLKSTQRALRRSKEQFQAVSEQAIDVIGVVGPQGTFRYLSASFESMTGLSREEMLGTNAFERVHPEDLEQGLAALADALADPEATVNVDLRYRHQDGTWRHLSVRAGQLWTPNGATEVLLNVRDNTEQQRYETLLEERRRRLELALAGGDLGMWDLDLNTGTNIINARWAEMLGYSKAEAGTDLQFFETHVHPEDLPRAYEALERHARGEIPMIDVEIRMRTKDGSWRWILDRGQIVEWNDDGTPKRAVGTHMDITDRKEAEADLRRSKTYAERLIGAMQDGFTVVNAEGVQVQVNTAFCEMTEFSEEELLGQSPPYAHQRRLLALDSRPRPDRGMERRRHPEAGRGHAHGHHRPQGSRGRSAPQQNVRGTAHRGDARRFHRRERRGRAGAGQHRVLRDDGVQRRGAAGPVASVSVLAGGRIGCD